MGWPRSRQATALVSVRSVIYFGLQSFAAIWFIREFGESEATANTALAAMLVEGAVGTLVGGRLVDRVGRRRVLVGSIVFQVPLVIAFVLAPTYPVAAALLTLVGFVTVMSFSVSVVMGQEYLPSRLGIASGVTLGFAIGVGGVGVAAALLGAGGCRRAGDGAVGHRALPAGQPQAGAHHAAELARPATWPPRRGPNRRDKPLRMRHQRSSTP